jgi:hypothetical protein
MAESPLLIIDKGKVHWESFISLQSLPSQTAYKNVVDELLDMGILSRTAKGNFMTGLGLLRSASEPLYFTRESDAARYAKLKWPKIKDNYCKFPDLK